MTLTPPTLTTIIATLSVLAIGCSGNRLHAQTEAATVTVPKALPECPAKHVTGGILASDGSIWIVSEGDGVFKLDPGGSYEGPWFHASYYTNYPETTSNFYGIAEDKQGRIWVGTDNQGVAVFNGESWKMYNRENALPGERIFDIAVSPQTGEVAIATSAGVTLYNPENEQWRDFTRADGLVEDQVECLAFSADGTLWLGYSCGGVSKSSSKNNYAKWETEQAPWYWDNKQRIRQPLTPKGSGLPSNLCNAMSVDPNGTVWLGTNSGLVRKAGSDKWKYIRGHDFNAKNKGIYGIDASKRIAKRVIRSGDLLPEDYITCLAPAQNGIWVGTRKQGIAFVTDKGMRITKHLKGNDKFPLKNKWITSIIPLPDESVCVTTYGGGVVLLDRGKGKWKPDVVAGNIEAKHPACPPVPDEAQLASGIEKINRLNKSPGTFPVLFWKDDWSTKGNWCGKYGQNYATLCATNAPYANETYRFPDDYVVAGAMGAHRMERDVLRNWVHWIDSPDNNNVLYCPTDATRCEAEWDDHGETYSMSFDGPDIWALARVPEGRHIVALYFYNPNGKEGGNGYRDYLIEVRKPKVGIPLERLLLLRKRGDKRHSIYDGVRENEMGNAISSPVLARTRVKDFAGSGVYKTFVVEGPAIYYFRVCRNYSMNTILNGVFIERIDKSSPANKWASGGHFHFEGIYPKKPGIKDLDDPCASELLQMRDQCRFSNQAAMSCLENSQVHLYRKALHDQTQPLVDAMRWNLNVWEPQDRLAFNELMRKSWDRKQEMVPAYRSAKFMPNAPNVIPFSPDEVMAMDRLKIDWKQYLPGKDAGAVPSLTEIKSILVKEIERFQKEWAEKSIARENRR